MTSKVRRLQKVGRPRLVYTLTEAADELFPQNYGNLARLIVGEVKETVGVEETKAMLRRVAERLAEEAPPATADQTFGERVAQVSDFMEEQGFLTRWEETDEGYVMTNVNCPYRRVTREHGEVCLMDTELLNRLLGVEPKRLGDGGDPDSPCSFLLVPAQ
jgi:predicted ArsR family transcriptional regulator